MKEFLYSVIVLPCFLLIGCTENDEVTNTLSRFDGKWIVEEATLDGVIIENWQATKFDISIINDSTLLVSLSNRPTKWELVWPDQSKLQLLESKTISARFRRDDIGSIDAIFIESSLQLVLHPPRSYSYDEDCNNQVPEYLICSEGGQWKIRLIRI
jgi:hypothetical protein